MANGERMGDLNVMRYLSFEVNNTCNLADVHSKCPINHPERYLYGNKDNVLSEDAVVGFWKWCRFEKDFRGIVMWHSYNEPTLVLDKIYTIMGRIKYIDPGQPFQLITNSPVEIPEFDLYKYTVYPDKELDDRILSATGEGKSYPEMLKINRRTGWCRRRFGWEMIVDYYGNLMLCCNDWRNEESVGNIYIDNWDLLLNRFIRKSKSITWKDDVSYYSLPRMCRACMATTDLCETGGSF